MNNSSTINGNALYSTKGGAQEYAPVGCNFYVGCSNGCKYCYLKKGVLAHAMGNNHPQLKKCFKSVEHAFEVFQCEAAQNYELLKKTGIFFSFSTDPLLPECQKLTWYATEIATLSDIPVKILTKSTAFFKEREAYLKVLSVKQKKLIHFGFSLTGCDEWEPNAPSNDERIQTLKTLKEWGYHTFASIEPVIDFKKSLQMIQDSMRWCEWYGIGLMTKNGYSYNHDDAVKFHKAVSSLIPEGTGHPTVYWKDSFRRLCPSLFPAVDILPPLKG